MSIPDWIVLLFTLTAIVWYGVWRGRGKHDSDSYLRAGRQLPWYSVLFGVMATQASAITFLSAPGQAFTDGMRFVQYYFGLPIAMVVICVTFIPLFRKYNIYTAYEYLEQRFDRKTRVFTSILFLLSRGLSTGISIYAPSIILSSILDWNIYLTNILVGGVLMIYCYRSGANAIAHTQALQFLIIIGSMIIAGVLLVYNLPLGVSFADAITLAELGGKMNVITTNFSWTDKYNIFSGIIGGFFLALSYFGTDQSQVGRYVSGKTAKQSQQALLMNGIVKVPMQFFILLIGALLFSLYTVAPSPIFFNPQVISNVEALAPKQNKQILERWTLANNQLQERSRAVLSTPNEITKQAYSQSQQNVSELRKEYKLLAKNQGISDTNDTNYIFLHYVRTVLPVGLIGLLFAVVILASWGSISAALHSLATSSVIDVHQLLRSAPATDEQQVAFAKAHSLFWGLFSIAVAMFAARMDSLIEAVNILGSLFYGTILGIFLLAFYVKKTSGTTAFYTAIIVEALVVWIYLADIVSFLWLNVIGALGVLIIGWVATEFKRVMNRA